MSGFIAALKQRIDAERAAIAEHIADGGCADWPAYRAKVAERKALGKAMDLALELHKRGESEDT